MEKEDCVFRKIDLIDQTIRKKDIKQMLRTMYNSICFSTFPYLVYKETSSKTCIQRYNSGNCIGFVYFMKMYLEANHNVQSVIIPASVPPLYKVEGTPHMCHCALLIPLNAHDFYVVDGALYFLEPMFCSLQKNKTRQIHNCNVHRHEKTTIQYEMKPCFRSQYDIDYNQTLPDDCLRVSTHFEDEPFQDWDYYLIELMNPDETIGQAFLLHKNEPFIMYTQMEDDMVKMKYKMYMENDKMCIKSYPEGNQIYSGNTYDSNEIYQKTIEEMKRYFDDYIM